MKPRFFTFCLAILLLSLLVSCSRDVEPAPNYDNRRLQLLGQTLEAISRHQTEKALQALETMAREFPADGFPAAAFRLEQKRLLLQQANQLLDALSLHLLIDFIRQTEREGEVFPELLHFSNIKDALDQLRLFQARMPWTRADALEKNLQDLQRHLPILEQSATFRSFLQQQRETLAQLRQQEQQNRERTVLDKLDRALIADNATPNLITQTAQQSPILAELLKNPAKLAGAQEQFAPETVVITSWELACALSWERLSADRRTRILARFSSRPPLTLAGAWLATRHRARPDAAAHFLKMLTERQACPPAPAVVHHLLTHHLLSQEQYQAWCWRSPCPGAAEIIARIQQVAQFNRTQEKSSTAP